MLSKSKIQIGIHIPPEDKSFNEMKELCLMAEELGFDLFTITDHFLNMANPKGKTGHPLECWTTLAGLAAITSKIYLGPLVSCAHYRHPTILAKMATTVDIISNGRLIFGIGAGWHEEEFKQFLGRFPSVKERMDGLEDAVIICKSMFTNEVTNYKGKIYSAIKTMNLPRPVKGYIPIMIGGKGEKRLLKIAAKYADIIHISGFPIKRELEHKINVIKKHCKKVGRDFDEIILATGFSIILNENKELIDKMIKRFIEAKGLTFDQAKIEVQKYIGPENIIRTLNEYHEIGIDLFTIPRLKITEMKNFAKEVLSKIR